MSDARTTAVVQRYLDELARAPGGEPAPVVRELLAGAADRLHLLCATLLHRGYPRLTRPPLNLRTDEMLGAVVERLLKALRETRPAGVRQFFALASQHIRWELNDLARRLDEEPPRLEAQGEALLVADTSHSTLGPEARRILAAIDALPAEEREVFELVRIQGLGQSEVAELLGTSTKTVQRRLNRGLVSLAESLGDLVDRREPAQGP
ncbi:MAG TPA: sigma-70 family RNA polymerase sigma factor [Planctomycetota bacterium]